MWTISIVMQNCIFVRLQTLLKCIYHFCPAWWESFLTSWRLLVLPDCHLLLGEWRNSPQQHLLWQYFHIDIGRCFITGQNSVFNLMEDLIECFLDYWVRSSGCDYAVKLNDLKSLNCLMVLDDTADNSCDQRVRR